MNTKIKGRDITGERFGKLVVIEKDPTLTINKQQKFYCKCDCGSTVSILRHSLITGNSTKCKGHRLNEYSLHEDYVMLDVSTSKHKNVYSKIDVDDIERVLSHTVGGRGARWIAHDNSEGKWGLYVGDTARKTRLHRFIVKLSDPTLIVDHINGDILDNRKQNLKITTRSENNKNMRKHINNTSGYTGVIFKDGLWVATISASNKTLYLGGFDTKSEANIAYRAAAKALGFSERHGL
jgi:HNH endonuclease/AP2 domain